MINEMVVCFKDGIQAYWALFEVTTTWDEDTETAMESGTSEFNMVELYSWPQNESQPIGDNPLLERCSDAIGQLIAQYVEKHII